MSVHSHDTQATSLTSAHSHSSREHAYASASERGAAQRGLPKLARASRSVDHHDYVVDARSPGMQHRHSASAASTAASADSSSSLPACPPRRKRGSALFAMFRKESRYCHKPSPTSHGANALRSSTAPWSNTALHGKPRGGKTQADSVMHSASQSPDFDPQRESDCRRAGAPPVLPALSLDSTAFLPASAAARPKKPAQRPRHEANTHPCPADDAFRDFRAQQRQQFDHISAFECSQRSALSALHQRSLARLAAQHEQARSQRIEQARPRDYPPRVSLLIIAAALQGARPVGRCAARG